MHCPLWIITKSSISSRINLQKITPLCMINLQNASMGYFIYARIFIDHTVKNECFNIKIQKILGELGGKRLVDICIKKTQAVSSVKFSPFTSMFRSPMISNRQ